MASAADHVTTSLRRVRTLTCSKALAVYVTRMAAKVPSLVAFLKTSEKQHQHFKPSAVSQSCSTDGKVLN